MAKEQEYRKLKVFKRNNYLLMEIDKKDPLLKKLRDELRASGRKEECDQLGATDDDPPEIDPGG